MKGWGLQKWGNSPWGTGENDGLYFNSPTITVNPVIYIAGVTFEKLMSVIGTTIQTVSRVAGISATLAAGVKMTSAAVSSSMGNAKSTPVLEVADLSTQALMKCQTIDVQPLK